MYRDIFILFNVAWYIIFSLFSYGDINESLPLMSSILFAIEIRVEKLRELQCRAVARDKSGAKIPFSKKGDYSRYDRYFLSP